MRILIVTWGCDAEDISESGVSARWVTEISKDHDVTLFAVSKPSRYGCVREQFQNLEVIEWKDIPMPSSLERIRAIVKPGYIPYYLKARRFLHQLVKEREFDVIHHLSPFAWRYPSPAAGLGVPLVRGPVAGGLKTPVGLARDVNSSARPFMLLRKTDQIRIKLDPLLRASYRNTDHLLMAAPYMETFLRPLPLGRYSIEIEHGLAGELKQQGSKRSTFEGNTINCLFVGRVVATKGVRFAIQALRQSSCLSSITLTVIGDGDDLSNCRAEVKKLNLQERVRFLGWCSADVVEEHYRQADVFVFPSFREPTGGVLLEAMAHGLPIIACAYGGPDYMVSDDCGIKISPSSEEQFVGDMAHAIDRLASAPELRAQMSAAAIARAQHEFGWTGKRKRMGELYAHLAVNKAQRPSFDDLAENREPATRTAVSMNDD